MTNVFITSIIETTATTVTIMTTVTFLTIPPSSNINTIKTPCPTGSSDTFINSRSWVGGILVGVVIGILVMVMIWVIVTIVRKKRRKMVDNIITYNNRYVQNCVLYVCNLQEQVIYIYTCLYTVYYCCSGLFLDCI